MLDQPLILHLETTGKNCSVCISHAEELLCLCEESTENYSHSKKLHTFVEWVLEGAHITFEHLNAISVSAGPGSYTGLRIGVSAAKGFAFALNIPLISTQTLQTLAVPYFHREFEYIISTIDAKRKEVFYQVFLHNKSLGKASNRIIDAEFINTFAGKKCLFLGSGAEKIAQFIEENTEIGIENFTFDSSAKISSKNAIQEGFQKWKNKTFEEVAYFEPNYVKTVHTTESKKNQ